MSGLAAVALFALISFGCIFSTLNGNEPATATEGGAHNSGAFALTAQNVDSTLASYELVFINFYADWCRFSNILMPVFEESAQLAHEKHKIGKKVLFCTVDCDKEPSIAQRFHITKYPTLKLIRNGQPIKKEYRGQRSKDAFVQFIDKELEETVEVVADLDQLSVKVKEAGNKQLMVGYFKSADSPNYQMYRKQALALKDDQCRFAAVFSPLSDKFMPSGANFVSKYIDNASKTEEKVLFAKQLKNDGSMEFGADDLAVFLNAICVPLVREITFENAEELTEEGLPFLIVFHLKEDEDSVEVFRNVVETELLDEKQNVQFLTADGRKFAHPLHHLGKSERDLPLIAIDSFRHMYLYSAPFQTIKEPGRLRQFLKDLYSGKLHREFHYGPEEDSNLVDSSGGTTAPESTFRKLAPSKNRYTLLKDEL